MYTVNATLVGEMGSAGSRRKKVAPAAEVNVDERRYHRSHGDFTARRARSDCHSDGQDSDYSGEDENHTEDKPNRRASQNLFFRSYGLCYGKSNPDQDASFTQEGLRDDRLRTERFEINQTCPLNKPGRNDEEKKSPGTTRASDLSSRSTTAVIPGNCDLPSMALSVFYDASEEDLMNTIEREFG